MPNSMLRTRIADRVADSFLNEARSGARHAMYARSGALLCIAAWVLTQQPIDEVGYYLVILAVFVLLGIAQSRVAIRAPRLVWAIYGLILLDAALLTFTLLYPNPLVADPGPPQMPLRFGTFIYFYVFLIGSLLSYAPRRVVWSGISIAVCWGIGVMWVLNQPDSITQATFPDWATMARDERLDFILHPNFVAIVTPVRDIVVMLIVTGILASIVWRMRQLALRQGETERQRANLLRYFSPEVANELATSDLPFAETRIQPAAILFVDIVGFTALAEHMEPKETMDLLREFHGRMAAQVFDHNGTLDKYIGDAVMATFGSLNPAPEDAANAVACARAMVTDIEDWNVDRAASGQAPIYAGIGAHFGEVVVGDIGDERRLEFAVIGDTVNVASRMERLTREFETPLVLSDDLVSAAREEIGASSPLLVDLSASEGIAIRGHDATMKTWTLAEHV